VITIGTLQTNKNYLIGAGVLVLLGVFGYWLYLTHISGDGTGANKVRQQLGNAIQQQSEAADTIKSVESGIGNSVKSVGNIENTVSHIANTNATSIATATDSTSLIADSQRILREIRQRGTSKTR
jgi:predicted negative regulator of RcsB-dependent stress response